MGTRERAGEIIEQLAKLGGNRDAQTALWHETLKNLFCEVSPTTALTYATIHFQKPVRERFGASSWEAQNIKVPFYLTEAIGRPRKVRREAKRQNQQPFSEQAAEELVVWAEETVAKSDDPQALLIALTLLGGFRAIEAAVFVTLEARDGKLYGVGWAKKGSFQRSQGEREVYLTGADPDSVILAVARLRSHLVKRFGELDGLTGTAINAKLGNVTRAGSVAKVTGWRSLKLLTDHHFRKLYEALGRHQAPTALRYDTLEGTSAKRLRHDGGGATPAYMVARLVPDSEAPYTAEQLKSGQAPAEEIDAIFRAAEVHDEEEAKVAERGTAIAQALVDDFIKRGGPASSGEVEKITRAALGSLSLTLDKKPRTMAKKKSKPTLALTMEAGATPPEPVAATPAPAPEPESTTPEPEPTPEPVSVPVRPAPVRAKATSRVTTKAQKPALAFGQSAATVAIPPELHMVLDGLAQKAGLSPGQLIAEAVKLVAQELEAGRIVLDTNGISRPVPSEPDQKPRRLVGRELVYAAINHALRWNKRNRKVEHKIWIGPNLISQITGSNKLTILAAFQDLSDEMETHHRDMGVKSPSHNRVARMEDGRSALDAFKEDFEKAYR